MASPFSFHCMVCFEEFDNEKRFPVVLPCGHTYICNECAGRLDRCMECRTPLVEYIKQGDGGGVSAPNVVSTNNQGPSAAAAARREAAVRARRGGTGGRANPPPPATKRRLPLPRNVVLMSLIEATELAAETVQGQELEPSLNESPMIAPSVLDIEEDEEEKIRTGTSLAISDCGTYAVAAKDGLEIFPSRPESLQPAGHEHSEQDVDTLVRFFHMDNKLDLDADGVPDDKKMEEDSRKNPPPGRLSWGDRVQIVSTQNGWAKLARGYGFVRAGAQQLVKVGGSVDRSCKLEAMLRLLSSRRKELREEQQRIDNNFIALMNELQMSLIADEDLTVIAADAFHRDIENDLSAASTVRPREFETSLSVQQPDITASNTNEDHTPLKPRFMEQPMTPPGSSSTGIFFCNGSDVLNAVLPLSSTRTQPPALPSVARSPAIAREFDNSNNNLQRHHYHENLENTPTRILTSVSHPSPNALRAGARAWREMHGRPASDGIDFRTGMSGHMALLSSNAHAHEYLAQTQRFFAGMSNHTGLTMLKAAAKKPEDSAPAFPSSGSSESNSVH